MSTSKNRAVANLNSSCTPSDVAVELQVKAQDPHTSVRFYILALSPNDSVALAPHVQVPNGDGFRLDMLPLQTIAKTDASWRKSFRDILDETLKGPSIFSTQAVEIKDRRLIHIFEHSTGSSFQACAVVTCRFSVVAAPPTIHYMSIDDIDSTKGDSEDFFKNSRLNETLDCFRVWRKGQGAPVVRVTERPKGLVKRLSQKFLKPKPEPKPEASEETWNGDL